jgi:uncharacterized membrane protein
MSKRAAIPDTTGALMTLAGLTAPTPQEMHAILVHFPIALAIAGVPLVYVTAVIATDRAAFRWVTVALYLIVAAGAYAALWSGDQARRAVPNTYPDEVWQTLELHERLGELVWIGALVTALLVLLGALKYKPVRITAMTVAMISSVATAALVGVTGHYGGQLVYRYGVGTPGADLLYARPDPPAPPPAEPIATDPRPPDSAQAVAPSPEAAREGLIAIRPISLDEAESVSYLQHVVPILDHHCLDCHYEGKIDGDLLLTSVADMLEGGEKAGPAIVPGDPDTSPMILYIRGILKPQMPKRQPPLSEEELHVLRMWIQAGAVDDSLDPSAVEAD